MGIVKRHLPAPRPAPTPPPDLRSAPRTSPEGVPSPAPRATPRPRPRTTPTPTVAMPPTPPPYKPLTDWQQLQQMVGKYQTALHLPDPMEKWYKPTQKGGKFPPPMGDPFSQVMGYGNYGGALFGASLIDAVRGRDPDSKESAVTHFTRLTQMGRGADAANLYFPTSIHALKQYAKSDLPVISDVSQLLLENPRTQSVVDGTARLLDPTGGGIDAITEHVAAPLLKMALAKVGPVLADAAMKGAEPFIQGAAANKTAQRAFVERFQQGLRYLQYLDRRFGPQRGAAEAIAQQAGKKGRDVKEAGDEAEMLSRNAVNAKGYSEADAAADMHKVFGENPNDPGGDLIPKNEREEIRRIQEGNSNLIMINRKNKPYTPEEQALWNKLMPRVETYRKLLTAMDKRSRAVWGKDAFFLSPFRFFPREGATLKLGTKEAAKGIDAQSDGDEAMIEEAREEQRRIAAARSMGGFAPRKTTLAKHRTGLYTTYDDLVAKAQMPGAKFEMNPDYDEAEAFRKLMFDRGYAARQNDIFNGFEKLGLLEPIWKELPRTESLWVPRKGVPPLPMAGKAPDAKLVAQWQRRMRRPSSLPLVKKITKTVVKGVPAAQPPGYVHFTELGDVRGFGLPVLRDAYVHPTIRGLIEEGMEKPNEGQGGLWGTLSSIPYAINKAAARLQVANPYYHPLINLRANIETALKNPVEWARFMYGVTSPRALARAKKAGAFVPHTYDQASRAFPRKWQSLAPYLYGEFNRFSRDWLYGKIEPRLAAGLHYAMTPRLGSAGAALDIRSILGEPENIGRDITALSHSFEFPAWFLSQMRRWSTLPLRKPNLFNAAQASIRDWNEYHGRDPRSSDEDRMFPPMYLGRTSWGDNIMLEMPHPADRALKLWGAGIDTAAGKGSLARGWSALASGMQPLVQPLSREAISSLAIPKSYSDWQNKVALAAPRTPWWKSLAGQVGSQAGYYFVPVPPLVHTEIAGTRTLPPSPGHPKGQTVDAQQWRYEVINAYVFGNHKKWGPQFRYGIFNVRDDANKLKNNPDLLTAPGQEGARIRKTFNFLHVPYSAGADGLSAWADQRYGEMQKTLQYYHFNPDPLSSGDQDAPMRGIPYIPQMIKTILGRAS